VLIGLALFLTWFVMQPVFEHSWADGITPMLDNKIGELDGIKAAAEPFRDFMLHNLRGADLTFFQVLAHAPAEDRSWRVIMPAFMVGELRHAFEMGFLLFLPFLVIDMVVASVLMSLGMMMLPPNVVSLPFKLVFFATVDGWRLVSSGLVQTFN
jgi:flagellar biosynthetic protein FliP